MKALGIFLAVLSATAMGATDLWWQKGSGQGYDGSVNLTSVSEWGYFWNLYDGTGVTRPDSTKGNAYAKGGVLNAITTTGNNAYSLQIGGGNHIIEISQALYFDSLTSSAANLTLDFGTSGSITTAQQINTGVDAASITLKATLTEAELLTLDSIDGVVTRTLLYGSSNNGIWNFFDKGTKTLTISNLESTYKFVGLVTSLDDIGAGEFALVYNGPTSAAKNTPDYVQLAVKAIPEPTTATLSLLALAGLAARRRRK